jgi:phosphoribosylformylglycinamidine synthase
MAEACRRLGMPIVSGNVSLYNETANGPILPTPVIGTVGLLDDRGVAIPMRWQAGDAIWLLGEPAWEADALAGSELAWRRGRFGGRPSVNVPAAARLVGLLPELAREGRIKGAHDVSIGGLGVALARMAIVSAAGATVSLAEEPDASRRPTAALFGERTGRALVAVDPQDEAALAGAANEANVHALRLGTAGGTDLAVTLASVQLRWALADLERAWMTPF